MRKLPILLFTAVFALSLALPAYAAESSNEELKAASQYLNSHGIMVGDGEGNMNFSAPKAETSMPPSANFRTFQTGPGNMPVTAPTTASWSAMAMACLARRIL